MSDMQWRRLDGTTGAYTGPLVNLGQGIPRPMRSHGFRRAVFDLAFGYASGFPLRDVVAFSLRSLWPTPPKPAVAESSDETERETVVGTVYISCPECEEAMPATVTAVVVDPDGDGRAAELMCTPNMTDIHAHVWGHEGASP